MKIIIDDPETGKVIWEIGPELEEVIRARNEEDQKKTVERLELLLQGYVNFLTIVGGTTIPKQDLLAEKASQAMLGLLTGI